MRWTKSRLVWPRPGCPGMPAGVFVRQVSAQAVHVVRRRFTALGAGDLLTRTDDAVCVVDPGRCIVHWNASARRLLGHGAEEVVGRRCYEVLEGRDDAGRPVCGVACAALRGVAAGRLVATRDLSVRTREGPRIRVNATTIALPGRWLAHLLRGAPPRPG